jgi:hypothetical protein
MNSCTPLLFPLNVIEWTYSVLFPDGFHLICASLWNPCSFRCLRISMSFVGNLSLSQTTPSHSEPEKLTPLHYKLNRLYQFKYYCPSWVEVSKWLYFPSSFLTLFTYSSSPPWIPHHVPLPSSIVFCHFVFSTLKIWFLHRAISHFLHLWKATSRTVYECSHKFIHFGVFDRRCEDVRYIYQHHKNVICCSSGL